MKQKVDNPVFNLNRKKSIPLEAKLGLPKIVLINMRTLRKVLVQGIIDSATIISILYYKLI
jgi:hypothetical protein